MAVINRLSGELVVAVLESEALRAAIVMNALNVTFDKDGRVAGFVTGTVNESNYRRSLFRKTGYRMAGALCQRLISRPIQTLRLMGERKDLIREAVATIVTRHFVGAQEANANSDKLSVASLVSIGVKSSSRRSGLGTALSELFVREAWDRGCGRITLSVRDDNVGAKRFYESMNWEEVSRSSKPYHGSSSVTYQKALTDEQTGRQIPVREEFLPLFGPYLGEDEWNEVLDTLQSGWITMGPKTSRFEELFAEYVGSRHAVAVSSCTAGLHLALVCGVVFFLTSSGSMLKVSTRTSARTGTAP